MWEVVNGDGTAGACRLHIPGVEMCGKTGTAQVRRLAGERSRGQGGDWKYRDHGLFVFFAPYDKPRYAGSVVIEHGMGGARAAAPVAKDVLTYLFDRPQAAEAACRARGRHGAAPWPSAWRRRARSDRRRACPRRLHDHARQSFPRPLARLPWRLIFLVAGIAVFGLIVLYSAAGGSMQPWAIKQGAIFFFFLAVAIGMSWLKESTIKAVAFPLLRRRSW